jgi:hypothetical protein
MLLKLLAAEKGQGPTAAPQEQLRLRRSIDVGQHNAAVNRTNDWRLTAQMIIGARVITASPLACFIYDLANTRHSRVPRGRSIKARV